MTTLNQATSPVRHPDRFFIDGQWVRPSSDSMIDVIDSGTEEVFFQVSEAKDVDMNRAITAARTAFDDGPWPRLTHPQRAEYLRAIASELRPRADEIAQIWPRQSGVLHSIARGGAMGSAATYEFYADLAQTFPFEEPATPTAAANSGSWSASRSAWSARSFRGTHRWA